MGKILFFILVIAVLLYATLLPAMKEYSAYRVVCYNRETGAQVFQDNLQSLRWREYIIPDQVNDRSLRCEILPN